MKKLLVILITGLLLSGCMVPNIPDKPIETCVEGHYVVYYQVWRECTCPGCKWYERGTYWVGNGDIYYVGEPVQNPVNIYGTCPIVH